MKRVLSLIMVALMLLLLPADMLASGVSGAQEEPTRVRQLDELRESNSDTYLLSDGSYECVIYAGDKYYKDDSGKYVEIDHSIVKSPVTRSGKNYQYKNAAGAITIGFSQNEPSVFVESGVNSISFSLAASNRTRANIGSSIAARSIAGFSLHGENYLEYRNVLPQTDFVYAVQNHGVKEYIILNSPEAPTEFSFNFTAEGYTAEKTEHGTVEFKDENGEAVFELGALFAVDSAGAYTEDLEYSITKITQDIYEVVVAISKEYVNAASRTFPVLIDPIVKVSNRDNVRDCFVSSKMPRIPYDVSVYIGTGYSTTWGIRRTFIRFELPDYINKEHIQNAYILLTRHSGSTLPNIKAYRATQSWTPSATTWEHQPSCASATDGGVHYINNYSYQVPVTNLVKRWYEPNLTNNYPNYGVMIKETYENDPDKVIQFNSSKSMTGQKPELHIQYVVGEYLSYGYDTNSIPISYANYGTVWNRAIQKSINSWNTSNANVSFNKTTSEWNRILVLNKEGTAYFGRMCMEWPSFGSKLRRFRIELSSNSIIGADEHDGSFNLENFIQSVLCHELGHTVWLNDNPSTMQASIMKYTRDRNSMVRPAAFDISNVSKKYK